jgi:hypothetical protein
MKDMRFGRPGPAGLMAEGRSEASRLALSLWSSEVEGLTLRSRDQGAGVWVVWFGEEGGERDEGPLLLLFGLCWGAESLKIWTVSVADETHSRVDAALKLML